MNNTTPIAVRLYGDLRARFGREYRLAVSTPGEAVRALCAVVPGFKAYLLQHSDPGYRVVVDRAPIVDVTALHHPSGLQSIKLVPVVAGAAGGGKIILGAALIALSVFTGGAGMTVYEAAIAQGSIGLAASSLAFSVGVSLVLGGVSQMLAGSPAAPTPLEKANNQPSFAFNGPVNLTAQGQCVPVCFGRLRVGSVVVSSGLSVAQLA